MRWRNPFLLFDQFDPVLRSIELKIDSLHRKVNKMSEQELELDAALQSLGSKVDTLVNAVDTLIAGIPPESSVDLTDEIAAVQQAALGIQGVTDKVTGAGEPPA